MRNTIMRHVITYTYPARDGDRREATYTYTTDRPRRLTHAQAQRIIDREIIGVRPTVTRVDSMAYAS